MINTIQSYPKIDLIEQLYPHLKIPFNEGEWGVLALDFDQVLVQAKPTLGNENCYQFLKRKNAEKGVYQDAHYDWMVKLREKITYEACESSEKINNLLKDAIEKGWTVKILTSRGLDMKDLTKKHLKQAEINFELEDVILKTRHLDATKKLLSKDESLLEWMKKEKSWETSQSIRVLFLDDSIKYCGEVSRVSEKVAKATVSCFQYTWSLPNSKLSKDQMKQLLIQLLAYREGRKIPYEHTESQVEIAKETLGVQEISEDVLYEIMKETAELDKIPFKIEKK